MPDKSTKDRIFNIRFAFFVFIILSAFFFYEIGNRSFADPDEGRYVEIPREMVVSNDYVTPRLNGMKYFEKPALFYWMQAGVIKLFGINEVSMRFWCGLFAVLGCLSVFFICKKYYSRTVALISTSVLATNLLYYAHSRLIILDLVTSVFMSGSLWCFFISFVKGDKRKRWVLLMYALAALTCLTKGLIGVVLPGLVVFLWMTITRNWGKLKEILYIPGICVFVLIFLPWHIVVSLKNSDFLHFYFVVEHFLRYTTKIHCRYQPVWFFVPILVVGFIPWTGFVLEGLKNCVSNAFQKKTEYVFVACWIFGILCFFSFSSSKLIPYILPIVQPISVLVGIVVSKGLEGVKDKSYVRGAFCNVAVLLCGIISYVLARHHIADVLQDKDAIVLVYAFFFLIVVSIILLLIGVFFRKYRTLTMILFVFVSANMMWVVNKAAPYYQYVKKPTTKNLANLIKLNKTKDDLVFCFKRYYQDFPVYLGDVVGVVDFVGELEFGAKSEPEKSKLISEDEFWNLWNSSDKRIFLLLSRNNYKDIFANNDIKHRILDFDKYFIVIINR